MELSIDPYWGSQNNPERISSITNRGWAPVNWSGRWYNVEVPAPHRRHCTECASMRTGQPLIRSTRSAGQRMAHAVIRDFENPSFVLNFQVRVADWDHGHGTHQGQQLERVLRSKAGHMTVLTNRAIKAFFSCKSDAIHTELCPHSTLNPR